MPIPAGSGDTTTRPWWAPDAQAIADVIPRRAIDVDGLGRGTFTDDTVPTDDQAARIGEQLALEVAAAVPNLPDSLDYQARRVAALGAASQIELSFYPENADNVAEQLQTRYRQALDGLTRAVELLTGVDQPGDGVGTGGSSEVPAAPQYNYPNLLGDRAPGGEWPFQLWPSDPWLYPNL